MVQLKDITADPELTRQCAENNYDEWGRPLSREDYFKRESDLHEILVNSGLEHRVFALVIEENDEVIKENHGNQVAAACEVVLRPLYYGGGVQARDHCFASVFVRPEFRRLGLATKLISSVTVQYINGDDQCSLWSDVGDYYARFGYKFPPHFPEEPRADYSIIVKPKPQPHAGKNSHSDNGNGNDNGNEKVNAKTHVALDNLPFELLTKIQVNLQILPEHQRLLLRDADSLYHNCQDDFRICVVVPHIGLYNHLQYRAEYTAPKVNRKAPEHFGARTLDGHGWITWTFMFGKNKLMILGVFGSANEIAILIAAAASVAAEYGCDAELFESSVVEPGSDVEELLPVMQAFDLKAEVVRRKMHVPMSKGPGIWMGPGFYAWF